MIIDKTNPNLKYEIYSKYKEILNEMNNDINLIINQLDNLNKILPEYIGKAKKLQSELKKNIDNYLICINVFLESSIDIINPKDHEKLLDNIKNKWFPFNLNIINVYKNKYIKGMKELNEKLCDKINNLEYIVIFDPPNINSIESDPNLNLSNPNSISEYNNNLNHINSFDNSYFDFSNNKEIRGEEEDIDINSLKFICSLCNKNEAKRLCEKCNQLSCDSCYVIIKKKKINIKMN